MTQISAAMVKALRDRTGAGMMDCKNALQEAEGSEDKAIEIIQKKGLAKVAKRAGAIAADGIVQSYVHAGNRIGVLVEVNSQTDFVARNEEFRAFVDNVCLQIASMSPVYVSREQVPATDIAAQRAIFQGQMAEDAKQTGKEKPPEAIAKILDGKVDKWLGEVCLCDQAFIVEADQTVQRASELLSAKLGEKISIRRFVRYELGEGIAVEKKDFAAEVAETMKG